MLTLMDKSVLAIVELVVNLLTEIKAYVLPTVVIHTMLILQLIGVFRFVLSDTLERITYVLQIV